MDIITQRTRLLQRHGSLRSERSSWDKHYDELSKYLLPRAGRFSTSDRNRGERRHNNIIDSTGTRALRVLAAGMLAGMTSPARPWFRLSIRDRDLADFDPVKRWLSIVTSQMLQVFAVSNTYRALHQKYRELGCFGTAASLVLEDFDSVIRSYSLTCGEYSIATDYAGRVDTLYREFERPVIEVVGEFGLENVSTTVRNLYTNGSLDQWVKIIHVIEPRKAREMDKRDAKNMAFKSIYFEAGGNEDKLLRESGYQRFPGLVPRWDVTGGDIYGESPGMEALGDVKQLQHQQLRKGQGIDYKTNPPIAVPTSLQGKAVDRLPGGVTYVDGASQQSGIRSLWEVNLDLSHLLDDIRDVRERVNSAFSADMFLMLAQSDATNMTATEVAERHEEKLLMLGPVLERLHDEMLAPLIDMTFERMLAAGVVPPPPEELQGQELDIVFVSMLAQAQRAIGVNSIDRFVANLGAIAAFKPDVLDKFDADEWVDAYSDMLGVDPTLIVPSDKVALIREQRANMQAQQAQLEAQNVQADTTQKLAAASTAEPAPMQDLINQFSGYNSPSATEVGVL